MFTFHILLSHCCLLILSSLMETSLTTLQAVLVLNMSYVFCVLDDVQSMPYLIYQLLLHLYFQVQVQTLQVPVKYIDILFSEQWLYCPHIYIYIYIYGDNITTVLKTICVSGITLLFFFHVDIFLLPI